MSVARHRALLFFTLASLGGVLLFTRLGEGPYSLWDEGLYGAYGRNALFHQRFLHAIDEHGQFPERWAFSKPPLSLWLVAASFSFFGPSLFALRLPFTTAALAVALLLFARGSRFRDGTRGHWLGFAAGLTWLLSHGVHYYGRMAAIEPLLIAFVLSALLAHARAMDEDTRCAWRWACLSGLCSALAFLTKQVVCALEIASASRRVRCREVSRRERGFAQVALAFTLEKAQGVDVVLRDVSVPLTFDRLSVRSASSTMLGSSQTP